jgi:hypothetical protein
VFDHCVQDSQTVVGILHDVLIRTKRIDSSIKNAYIRSDNAGCYHSAQTILSLPQISHESKIHIRRIGFCDPQGGKGPCDRYAAVIKSHVRRFLSEKHNVTTAAEFVEATYANEGIRGVYAYESALGKPASGPPLQFAKICLVNNFSFEPSGVRMHRSWKVGDGKLILFLNLERPVGISTVVCTDLSIDKIVLFATAQTKNKQRNSSKQSTDIRKDTYVSRLFECYEEVSEPRKSHQPSRYRKSPTSCRTQFIAGHQDADLRFETRTNRSKRNRLCCSPERHQYPQSRPN